LTYNKALGYTVFDVYGKIILSQSLQENREEATVQQVLIDLSNVAGGIYLLSIEGTNGRETYRIVRK